MSDIEKRCLSLSNKEKKRLIEILRKSLETKDVCETFEKMHDAIVKVFGKEVLTKSRDRDLVVGRTILAYSCAVLGWSECTIGRLMQRDHSSINLMKKNMTLWMKFPNMFKKENDLYVEFLTEWNNETDR